MKLTPVTEKFVLHWGEMGSRWGMNRSVAQIHALLYVSPEAMSAEQIAETLGLARSNVSNSIKELQSWKLVETSSRLGDRKDYYNAHDDMWEMLITVADGRKEREIDPTMVVMRECLEKAETDKEIDPVSVERMQQMMEFMEIMLKWYDGMRALKTETLVKVLKLGSKVVRFIPGS